MSKSFDGDIRLSVGLDTGQAEKDAKKLGKDVASAVDSGGKSSKILEIEAQLRKAKDAAADAKKKLDDLKNTKMPTDEFASLSEQARELADRYAELAKLKERWSDMGIDPNSTAAADQPMIATLRALEQEMDEVYHAAEQTTAKMAEMMQTGTAYRAPETTAEWAEAARQVSYTSDRVGVLEAKLRETQEAETQAANTVVTGSARASSALAKLKAVGLAAGRVLLSGLKAAGRAAGQLAAKLGKVVGRATLTGLKKIASGITGIGRRANNTGLSIGRLLKYAVGLIGLGTLLSKMRSAIAEGFQTLAASDSNLNSQLNATKTALANLKLSFAAAFQPILTVVLPIINTLANALTSIINKIGMFFAVLTGQSYYNKVVSTAAATEGYASAIEDTGTAAAEAAKEMDEYLSPVDELNKLQDTSSSGSSGGSGGGGGGGAGGGGGDTFEQVAIESPISEFADKVKALINAEDWEGLGELLADKVNGCLQKVYDAINWDNVGPKITKFVTAFTETFNSFVDNVDWELAGRTVGAGINTIVNTLDLAITGINWTNLGTKFAEGVNGLLDEVNWTNLGRMIGNKIMILPNIAAGFVTTLDWSDLGESIAESINGFFETFSFPDLAHTIAVAINGVFDMIGTANATLNWSALSDQISGGINDLFSTIRPADWAQGLGNFVVNLNEAIADTISSINWEEIAHKISQFIENIPWSEVVQTSLDLGGRLLVKLQNFVSEFLSKTDWTDALSEIMVGIYNWLVYDFDWGGFFLGLLKVLKSILLDLPLAVIMAPIDFLCKIIFGKDASAVWNDIVEWFKGVGSAMWGALVQAWNGVSEFFQNVWDLLTAPFVKAAEWFGEIFTNAWDAICKAWENVGLWFQKLWAYIKLVAVEALEAILGFLDTTLGWIPGLGDSIRSAKDAVAGVADSIRAEIDDINKEMDENLGKTRTVPVELKKTIGWTEEDSPMKLVKKLAAATTVVNVEAKPTADFFGWLGKTGKDGEANKIFTGFQEDAKKKLTNVVTIKEDQSFENAKDGGYFRQVLKNFGAEAKKALVNMISIKEDPSFKNAKDGGYFRQVLKNFKDIADKSLHNTATITADKSINTARKDGWLWAVMENFSKKAKSSLNKTATVTAGKSVDTLRKGGWLWTVMGNFSSRANNALHKNVSVTADTWAAKNAMNAVLGVFRKAITNANKSNFWSKAGSYFTQIPLLAQGAVIPAGAPFLAMLGDQSNGRNLEAPESLIRQIVREETAAIAGLKGGGSTKVVAQVGRKTLFEVLIDEAKLQQQITGRNPFDI